LFIDILGLASVYEDIAIVVFWVRYLDLHFLVPTMHAADRIRMYTKRQILMYTGLAPEDAGRIRVFALIWVYSLDLVHTPISILLTLQCDQR
jgi:hypothetical protein